ncbi:MAG: hypothetical protein KGQ42_01585 [Alphaproteobacteria bacterium]|nr:hypothetical protein [Alphaproteobacteria bacterium]MDE2041673.1 hypothetical protein [Alphaproteobacteria bacterium]MDE2340400.1 hypothetical protein [Alphaproteobacteria bacterium]
MAHFPKPRLRSAWADLKTAITRPMPHKLGILGACAAFTYFLVWAFVTEFSYTPPRPEPVLTYVHIWAPHRTQAQITASNHAYDAEAKREAAYEAAAEAERRASAKRLYDALHRNGLY